MIGFYKGNIDPSSRNGIKRLKGAYKTQGWYIKYMEEQWNLNEVAYFTHEIDIPKVYSYEDIEEIRIPLMMQVTLYFTDKKDLKQSARFQYEKADSKVYRLGDMIDGVYKFIPVEFTGSYNSILNMSVHCTLTDMKFCKQSKMRLVSFILKMTQWFYRKINVYLSN